MYRLLVKLQTIKEEIDLAYENDEVITIDEANKLNKIGIDLCNIAKSIKLQEQVSKEEGSMYY